MTKVAVGQIMISKASLIQERDRHNFYPTPECFLEWLFPFLWTRNLLDQPQASDSVLDVGVGTGNWGRVYYRLTGYKIFGVEKNLDRFADADLSCYQQVFHQDIMDHSGLYGLVIGNPPYTKGNKKKQEPSTTAITDHVLNKLCPIGTTVFLLPTNFRHGETRFRTLSTPYAIIDLVNRINFKSENGKGGSYPGEFCVTVWDNMEFIPDYYRGIRAKWG